MKTPTSPTPGAGANNRWLALASFAAMALGAVAGLMPALQASEFVSGAAAMIGSATRVWVSLLQLLVPPMVAAHLYLAIRPLTNSPGFGRMTGRTFSVFVGTIVIGNLIGLGGGYLLFAASTLAPEALTNVTIGGSVDATAPLAQRAIAFLTSTPVLLGTLAAAMVAGLVARFVPASTSAFIDRGAGEVSRLADRAMSVMLKLAPVPAFGLAWSLTTSSGGSGVAALLWYLIGVSILLVVLLAALMIVGALAAPGAPSEWIKALGASQMLALVSRSSLATVPLLLQAGKRIGLPATTREFVVPFSAAMFKPNSTVTGCSLLVFLSFALQIELSLGQYAYFLLIDAAVSLINTGVPRVVPRMTTLPLFLAVGIPAEAYVLARSVTAPTDALKTVVNTTGYFTAATVVAWMGRRDAPDAVGETGSAA